MIINPEVTVFLVFSGTIGVLAYILRIFEMPYFRKEVDSPDVFNAMDDYFNAIWCTTITMTTVGYGDLSPATTPGRCVAMTIGIMGSFLISIVVVTVLSVFELTHPQKMALRHIRLTRRAASTIAMSIKYFLAKKRRCLLERSNTDK